MDWNMLIVNVLVPLLAALLGATVGGFVSWRVHTRDIERQEAHTAKLELKAYRSAAVRLQEAALDIRGSQIVRTLPKKAREVQARIYGVMAVLPETSPERLRENLEWAGEVARAMESECFPSETRNDFVDGLVAGLRTSSPSALNDSVAELKTAFEDRAGR